MQVKLDTKEKFHVITILEASLTANMTAELETTFAALTQNDVKNFIVDMEAVQRIDLETSEKLATMQQTSYENSHSFVICGIQPAVETFLDEAELLELLNITPTLSEAMDIVQMEEIERELFNDD